MANEKLISALSTIERALGLIEGVSCGLDKAYADTLLDAIGMIDAAVKEITDGK
jgi:hypothetical protein